MLRKRVKIVGLPRSGTRYLSMLVSNNYDVLVDTKGKHHTPATWAHEPSDLTLVISKRFDRWLTSSVRGRYEYDITRSRMYNHRDTAHTESSIGDLCDCAYDVYNKFHSEWAAQLNVVFVRYEDLLRDSAGYLADIAKKNEWPTRPRVDGWAGCGPDEIPEWRRAYYLE